MTKFAVSLQTRAMTRRDRAVGLLEYALLAGIAVAVGYLIYKFMTDASSDVSGDVTNFLNGTNGTQK